MLAKTSVDNNLKDKLALPRDSDTFWSIVNKRRVNKSSRNEISLEDWKAFLYTMFPRINVDSPSLPHIPFSQPLSDKFIEIDEISDCLKNFREKSAWC